MLITYIIPIITSSVYVIAVLAYLDTTFADYLTIVSGERVISTHLITTPITIDEFIIIIIIWHYLTPLGVIVAFILSYLRLVIKSIVCVFNHHVANLISKIIGVGL